jgi:formiminotetrahydrofolate cyclodeaminase
MRLSEFVAALSEKGRTATPPAGGSTAALTVTLAASLCVMTARLSARQIPHAEAVLERARELRDKAAPLAQADAEGYRKVLAARRAHIEAALARASEVPLEVARIGAEVAALARRIASEGNPAVRGDAVAAALLAAAGARTAAVLVGINLADQRDDGRQARALHLASEAERAASDAQRAVTGAGRTS